MFKKSFNILVLLGLILFFCKQEARGKSSKELQNETLVITAYERLQDLYIDGQLQSLTNGYNWNLPDYIQLQPTNRLIALYAANIADTQCAGVLASVNDGSFLTNNVWKCVPYQDANWVNLGFDDSSWSNAVEYGSNGNHSGCNEQQVIGNISSDSKWIWGSDLYEFVVYCRGYLPVCDSSPCQNNGTCLQNSVEMCRCLPQFTGTYCKTKLMDGTLVITAYAQILSLYIDGQQQSLINSGMWNKTDRTVITNTNRLIAVSAEGDGTCGGILASVGDSYVLTNAEWKCSKYQDGGWMRLGFVETPYYLPAVELGSNGGGHTQCSHLQTIPDISYDAMWIWDSDQAERTIFCRGYIPVCDSSPCLNNGTCLQNDVDMCRCLPQFTGTYCESHTEFTLTITAKTTLYELYIDGLPQSLSHATNVSVADEIPLPSFGRLVAVTAIDTTSTCAGILASATGDYLLTDASWKCHTDGPPLWYTFGFDDTDWIDAYVIGPNNNVTWPDECRILNGVASISQNADWIWTSSIVNTPIYDDIIYCRAYLPLCERESPCRNGGTCNKNSAILCTCIHGYTGVFCENELTSRLSITAKSMVYEFYIDGIKTDLTYNNNWTVADEIELSSVNRLISVLAVDSTSTCAGILASVTDDFMVTDASWRCRIGAPPQWYILGFDDSDWTDTYVIGPNANVSWPEKCKILTEIPAISQNAYWIWTSTIPDVPYYDSIIYCRAYLPICEKVQPCRNGGTCRENSVNLCTCPIGFTGVYCEAVACDGDAPCQNGGTCIQGNAEPCLCPPEFTGTFCEFSSLTTESLTAATMADH